MGCQVVELELEDRQPQFSIIAGDDALALYPEIREHFERALEYSWDKLSPNEVLARVLLNEILLLVCTRGGELVASFTFERLVDRSGEGTLHCMTLAGDDLEAWVDEFLEVWEKLARDQRCKYLTIKGREGWTRYARNKGFKHQYTIMRREVE